MKENPVEFKQIRKILPQGYPFLFIDRIEQDDSNEMVAYKNITHGDFLAVDMATKRKVFPPFLIVEAMGQAAIALAIKNPEVFNENNIWLAGGAIEVNFYRDVFPGDRLKFKNNVRKLISKGAIIESVASVDDETVAEGTLFSIAKPKGQLFNE